MNNPQAWILKFMPYFSPKKNIMTYMDGGIAPFKLSSNFRPGSSIIPFGGEIDARFAGHPAPLAADAVLAHLFEQARGL
jgi:hypothetical protein